MHDQNKTFENFPANLEYYNLQHTLKFSHKCV
jgi:hypothetical protein